MANQELRFLNREEVKQALPMAAAIEAMKEAFALLSARRAIIPPRHFMDIPSREGTVLLMPSYVPQLKKSALKLVTIFKENAEKGLPLIQALVMLMDATDGRHLALMEGSYLTALRTGAASGAATDLLAREESRIAAVYGTGAQSETQIEAICAVRPIEEIMVFGRSREKSETFARKMSERFEINIHAASAPEDVSRADVICAATTSELPVFSDSNLKPGVHINGVGSYRPDWQEVPAETVVRAKVVIDEWESCWAEAGDLIIPVERGLIKRSHVHCELGEIVSGTRRGRESDEEITFFKSVGNAVQDLAAATKVLAAAEAQGLGTMLSL